MFKLSNNSKQNLKGVDVQILKIIEHALEISTVDFGIPKDGGIRTAERQKQLFELGLSKCDGKVYLSEHQSGKAFDVYAYVDGKASWDRAHLTSVAASILQAASVLGFKLEWGGHWKSFVDMPHFQLIEV